MRGSGYPVRFPVIVLADVSAGGGTLAWLDAAGVLRVGPLSAGADPGPACYGHGARPTVTDADVVLGRSNPRALLGGSFPIDAARARSAIGAVAAPLGGDVERTAAGIVSLVDAEMAKVLRIVSLERGHDPRDFTLLAFGGAGPLHACSVAADIGVARIIVPPHPGVFSAYGLLAADVRSVAVRSVVGPADAAAWSRVAAVLDGLTSQTDAELASQAVPRNARSFTRQIDLRYAGQSTELPVVRTASLESAVAAFHARHEQRYGFAARDEPVEIVTARVIALGATAKPPLNAVTVSAQREPAAEALIEQRDVFDGEAFRAMPVYARAALRSGDVFDGPGVVEQYDATSYVGRGWHAAVDALQNLVLDATP
ncbi:MAG: hydantoinase/oxoprolinase family protein [Candidatus Eremiobacteraeota bacterium]|nr:hydantoinase/oxoprolinase family protein [Candidatus Eremiobacteraeota bacterium]